MRRITPVGKLSLNVGSFFLFAAALLTLALYNDDQNASWFNGVSTSMLWPIDMGLLALGLMGIIFMLQWGRAARQVGEEVLHINSLVNHHAFSNLRPIETNKKVEAKKEEITNFEFENDEP